MVEINPPSIKQLRSKMKAFGRHTYGARKKIQLPHHWRWNVLSCHKISNGKVSTTTRLTTKKKFVAMQITIEKMQSPQDWQLNFGHYRIL